MNSPTFLPQVLLSLLFAVPLFAQPGPPLFQSGFGQGFASADFGFYNLTGSGGGQSCVSTVPNPYPNPKLGQGVPLTNCTIGSSLSVTTPFQGQLVNSFLNGQGIQPSESGVSTSTVTRGNVVATATVSNFTDSSMLFAPQAGTNSYYYQEGLPSGVNPGGTLTLKFQIQGSTGKFGCLSANFTLVSDDPTSQVSYSAPLSCSSNPQTVDLEVTTPPLTIGPSGTYTISINANALEGNVGTATIHVFGCGAQAMPMPPSGSFLIQGWSGKYQITQNKGLELDDVMLQNRYMAASMNLPYLQLQTSKLSPTSCKLQPDSNDASCRSRLLAFDPNKNGAVEATYQLDNIPANSGSCMIVTQRYEFAPVLNANGGPGCEPSGLVTCARFNPMVTYEFLPEDAANESLVQMDAAQRMQFQADHISPNTAAMFHDHDSPLPLPVVDALFGDPMTENVATAIFRGSAGVVDNYHQTSNPAGVSEPGLDLTPGRPNAGPGCIECIHIHWRWGAYFGSGFGGGNPLVPGTTLVSANAVVENGPSDQTVTVAATDPARDPGSVDIRSAVAPGASLQGLVPAFWYVGSGFKRVDTFFGHGGFFAPTSAGIVAGIATKLSGFHYDGASKLYTQTITLQNTTNSAITGPLTVALDNLSANATLANQAGVTRYAAPLGSPYVFVSFSGGAPQLQPGQTATVVLQFSNPTNGGITHTPRVLGAGIP